MKIAKVIHPNRVAKSIFIACEFFNFLNHKSEALDVIDPIRMTNMWKMFLYNPENLDLISKIFHWLLLAYHFKDSSTTVLYISFKHYQAYHTQHLHRNVVCILSALCVFFTSSFFSYFWCKYMLHLSLTLRTKPKSVY